MVTIIGQHAQLSKKTKDMKHYIYIVLLLVIHLTACVKDDSIVKSKELDNIEIAGIADSYSVSLDEVLSISPIVNTQFTSSADLDYLWYAFNQTTQNHADTISKEKNLAQTLQLAPGDYTLVLKVTDKTTGVFYKSNTNLRIVNDYTRGLLILSENDGQADIAFYNTDLGKFIENTYKKSNGESLGIDPVGVYYYPKRGNMPSEILILCKDQRGGVVADPITFGKFRDIKDSFYVPLEGSGIINVEGYIARSTSGLQDYLVIDGQIYSRSANAAEVLFRPPLLGVNYYSSPINFNTSSRPAFYDELNGRFLAQPGTNALLSTFTTKQSPEIIDPDQVNMHLLFAAQVSGSTFFTVFENKAKTSRYILKFLASSAAVTFRALSNYEVTATNIMQATAFAGATTFQNYLFYAVGNRIYIYNVDTMEGDVLTTLGNQVSINYMDLQGTELRIGYLNSALSGKKGGFMTYNITTVGGIKATETLKKEGFCDKIIDIETKN